MQIQISWFLQKPSDLDLPCLQRQDICGFHMKCQTTDMKCQDLFSLKNNKKKKLSSAVVIGALRVKTTPLIRPFLGSPKDGPNAASLLNTCAQLKYWECLVWDC